MTLDVSLLRRAKVENLERLARSLGLDVPKGRRESYVVRLIEAIATKVRRDAMLDELAKLRARSLPNVIDGLKAELKKGRAA